MSTLVKILSIEPVTHNVRRYRVEKPKGFKFTPGQATELSLDKDGWREKKNPFTFTALAEWPDLEFTIKSYTDRPGVTNALSTFAAGDGLILRDPWGTITYKGPGTFIAGGAGITPFIAILRQLNAHGGMKGNCLIVSNRTERDIILRDEFEAMQDLEVLWTVTDDPKSKLLQERIDRAFLEKHVGDFSGRFYLCGPDPMVNELREILTGLGASTDSVTFEKP